MAKASWWSLYERSSAGKLCKGTGSQRELRTVRPLGGQSSQSFIRGTGAGHMVFLKNRSISKGKSQRDSAPLSASCTHVTPPKHQPSGWSHNAVAYIKSLTQRVCRFFEVLCWAAVGDPVTQFPLSSQALNLGERHLILGISFAWKHVPSVPAGLASCSQHTVSKAYGPKVNETSFLSNKTGLSNINMQLFLQMCDNMPQTYRAVFPRNATNVLGCLPWYSGLMNSSKAAWDQLKGWSRSRGFPVRGILLQIKTLIFYTVEVSLGKLRIRQGKEHFNSLIMSPLMSFHNQLINTLTIKLNLSF